MNLVVSFRSPLERRFGAGGFEAIRTALAAYQAALPEPSAVFFLDDPVDVEPFGLTASAVAADRALSAIRHLRAALGRVDSICLLGSEAIVPAFEISNPVRDRRADPDAVVLTDNPYGAEADSLEHYLAPSVPVGRFPEPPGRDATAFVAALEKLSDQHRIGSRLPGAAVFFNAEWIRPTLSVASVLPAVVDEHQAPGYEVTTGNREDLTRGFLYFNLHGFPDDPTWKAFNPVLGQFTPVLTPQVLDGLDLAGTVVFAENCYATVMPRRGRSCAVALLEHGASACVGATGLAFGSHIQPDLLLDHADFLAHRFFARSVAGARPSEALVEARLDYFNDQTVPLTNPFKQKTLLQYRLLGDPALN